MRPRLDGITESNHLQAHTAIRLASEGYVGSWKVGVEDIYYYYYYYVV